MSRRPGSSRTLGPIKQCAVYVRGDCRCAWCADLLASREKATIDHLDGNPRNNDPRNLVPSCSECNNARAYNWTPGRAWTAAEQRAANVDFDLHLESKGATLDAALARVYAQRRKPLDRTAGRVLAELWHAGRLRQRREQSARRSMIRQAARRFEREERAAIQGEHIGLDVAFNAHEEII